MTTVRHMKPKDILKFGSINLDSWTETFSFHYIMKYIFTWNSCNFVMYDGEKNLKAYFLGKIEINSQQQQYGHVSAITINPTYRNMKSASNLMDIFEKYCHISLCSYVDLFVRESNKVAINFYHKLSYNLHLVLDNYYETGATGKTENGYEMRKMLPTSKIK